MKVLFAWVTDCGHPPKIGDVIKFQDVNLKVLKLGPITVEEDFSSMEIECSIIIPAGSDMRLLETILGIK